MKIQSMRLENYRCFSDLSINFDERLTVLVGLNGAGKTAVLDAVEFFLRTCFSALEDFRNAVSTPPQSDLKLGNDSVTLSYQIIDDNIAMGSHDFDFPFSKNELSRSINLKGAAFISALPDDLRNAYDSLHAFCNEYRYQKAPILPFTVYYSAKRILNSYDESKEWFIKKAADEALEGQRLKDYNFTIPELSAVRKAVAMALGDYNEPYARTDPHGIFITHKDQPDQSLQIEQLSDGYRSMLTLVMDMACNMAQANEKFDWPAIVLIDEMELHLHPSWQQRVLPSLMEIFPNAQFIVSTHSPQILTSIAAKHIRILRDDTVYSMSAETEGAEASRVLEDVLGVNSRPLSLPAAQDLQRYADMVANDEWDTPQAETLRQKLESKYRGSEPLLHMLALEIENKKWDMENETGA